MTRQPIPVEVQTKILLLSKRRCCICYGLQRDTRIRSGQIAHLDQDNRNSDEDNLAFLCLEHHDQYDSRTSQSKGLRIDEVKSFRDALYKADIADWQDKIESIEQHAAQGGCGGSGEIFGNGTVIGGQGGQVGFGGQGRGGDGGGGVIHGNGLIIGGAGGSVDGSRVWFPPARSGFDYFLAQQGQTPDWGVMYPGYGGMSAGYLERHRIVTEVRATFFQRENKLEKLSSSKIDDVPLEYVNSQLDVKGLDWRAKVDGQWYLYYIP